MPTVAVRSRLRRVADRDNGVADLDEVGVAERERAERARVGVDLEDGDVGGGVVSDDGRVEPSLPEKLNLQRWARRRRRGCS